METVLNALILCGPCKLLGELLVRGAHGCCQLQLRARLLSKAMCTWARRGRLPTRRHLGQGGWWLVETAASGIIVRMWQLALGLLRLLCQHTVTFCSQLPRCCKAVCWGAGPLATLASLYVQQAGSACHRCMCEALCLCDMSGALKSSAQVNASLRRKRLVPGSWPGWLELPLR